MFTKRSQGTEHETARAARRAAGGSRQIYACRYCGEAVKVSAPSALGATCHACGESTWEEDGRCHNWVGCEGERRATGDSWRCHACGFSVWQPVTSRR